MLHHVRVSCKCIGSVFCMELGVDDIPYKIRWYGCDAEACMIIVLHYRLTMNVCKTQERVCVSLLLVNIPILCPVSRKIEKWIRQITFHPASKKFALLNFIIYKARCLRIGATVD